MTIVLSRRFFSVCCERFVGVVESCGSWSKCQFFGCFQVGACWFGPSFGLRVLGTITIFFVFRRPSTITNCFVLVVWFHFQHEVSECPEHLPFIRVLSVVSGIFWAIWSPAGWAHVSLCPDWAVWSVAFFVLSVVSPVVWAGCSSMGWACGSWSPDWAPWSFLVGIFSVVFPSGRVVWPLAVGACGSFCSGLASWYIPVFVSVAYVFVGVFLLGLTFVGGGGGGGGGGRGCGGVGRGWGLGAVVLLGFRWFLGGVSLLGLGCLVGVLCFPGRWVISGA